MPNYILVCSDGYDSEGFPVSASEVADKRLRESRWPLYRRTKHRRAFAKGDRLLIYVGGVGAKRQSFVAIAAVATVINVDGDRSKALYDREKATAVATWLELSSPKMLEPAIDIRSLLTRLSFAPSNPQRWGPTLIGGVRAITDLDWEIITNWQKQ